MKKKAAVLILLGQSNAVGHKLPMKPEDVIRPPMKNVFGLSRVDNRSLDLPALTWSGYTSFGMNLAEEQDNTYSIANCLAADWQGHIDSGNAAALPNLLAAAGTMGRQAIAFFFRIRYNRVNLTGDKTPVPGGTPAAEKRSYE